MKKILSVLLIIVILIGLFACKNENDVTDPIDSIPTVEPIDLSAVNPHNDVYYQIFVRSFADSNGDGIGDINGITENLDYLEELGITALWLLPINPSPSYHGYNVTDYYDIHPDYGTLEDFENLIEQSGQRGIKIVIDLVINHTSDQHPWFVSAATGSSSPYRDYYIWNNGYAFESFVGGMKDLNFHHEAVKDEMKSIMDFYLEMGVHGFRLDAAKHLIESINPTWDNTLLILEFNMHIKENYPDSFIVSEVFEYVYDFYADYFIGSDSVFNFYLAQQVWDKIGSLNNSRLLVSNLNRAYNTFREVDPDFVDSPFIGNHDLDRVASMQSFMGFDAQQRLSLAARFLLTVPGSPFIYYGDELGMKGYRYEGTNIPGYGVVYDEYRRQPFIWGEAEYQTSWLPSDGSNDATLSLEEQKEDESSLFNVYKEMIQIRRENPALMYGNTFMPYKGNQGNLQGFVRYYQYEDIEQAVLVIHNVGSNAMVIDVAYESILYGSLNLQAYGTLILEINPDEIEAYT
ncbi:alpha-amylase family glycosyl hydrolase [Peloplasma aerotolerans]|uniref:Alpha-amylase n=1 Tax=Peloplasma aerotolerans TaxID=3044389 RepID=A0AAW6U9X1_9MOLU|nr:alpha-amylase family glycosyl hydrolase [Mariniplasma sp. M4Ah]MDI6453222.1 alpha-amylase family glycosyl hydrolase [Mariniplasma sp. M4Ah]